MRNQRLVQGSCVGKTSFGLLLIVIKFVSVSCLCSFLKQKIQRKAFILSTFVLSEFVTCMKLCNNIFYFDISIKSKHFLCVMALKHSCHNYVWTQTNQYDVYVSLSGRKCMSFTISVFDTLGMILMLPFIHWCSRLHRAFIHFHCNHARSVFQETHTFSFIGKFG